MKDQKAEIISKAQSQMVLALRALTRAQKILDRYPADRETDRLWDAVDAARVELESVSAAVRG